MYVCINEEQPQPDVIDNVLPKKWTELGCTFQAPPHILGAPLLPCVLLGGGCGVDGSGCPASTGSILVVIQR